MPNVFTIAFGLASSMLIALSISMIAPLHPPPDCMRWLAEDNVIIAYDPTRLAHTYVLQNGEWQVNEFFPEEKKDDCTRALHSRISSTVKDKRHKLACNNVDRDCGYVTEEDNCNVSCYWVDGKCNGLPYCQGQAPDNYRTQISQISG